MGIITKIINSIKSTNLCTVHSQPTTVNIVKKIPVINFFGGPCSGKSTMAARIFSDLKMNKINCELVTEYAKQKVWENNMTSLQNQIYIFANQQYRLWTVSKHVDLIVTDSPLILSNIYQAIYGGIELGDLVRKTSDEYHNINIFLKRCKEYNPKGRTQTENEAIDIDNKILEMLNDEIIDYEIFNGDVDNVNNILKYISDDLVHNGYKI